MKYYIDGLKKLTVVEKRNFFTIVTRILNNIYKIFFDIIWYDIWYDILDGKFGGKSPKYNKPHSLGNIVDIVLKKIPKTDYSYIMALSGKRQFENLYKPLIQAKLDSYSSNLADYYYSSDKKPPSVLLNEFIERGIFTAIVSLLVELQDLPQNHINSYLKEANAATLLRIKSTNETNTSRLNTRRRSRLPNIVTATAVGAAGAAGTGLNLTRHRSRSRSGSGSRSNGSRSNGSIDPFNISPSERFAKIEAADERSELERLHNAVEQAQMGLFNLNGRPFQTRVQQMAAKNAAIRRAELREEMERQREEMERQRERNKMERQILKNRENLERSLEIRKQRNAPPINIGSDPTRPPF